MPSMWNYLRPPVFGDNNEFVRFSVQSTGGGVNTGNTLFIFDHRSASVAAAKEIKAIGWAPNKLKDVFEELAKVVIVEKKDGVKTFFYINLYPVEARGEATALLEESGYFGKHNAGFKKRSDKSFWSWQSESSSRTGAHHEMVLVSLTDDDHKILMHTSGYANNFHEQGNMRDIGLNFRRISEEELAAEALTPELMAEILEIGITGE